jgi:hypothetical protein
MYKDQDISKLLLTPDRSVDGWCFNCSDMKSCLDEMSRNFVEIFEYDPSILTIDFYSAHFYPLAKSYGTSPFQDMLGRFQGHFVLLSDILEIPFILGETGFRSEPGIKGPDGSNDDQKHYAEFTLHMTRF